MVDVERRRLLKMLALAAAVAISLKPVIDVRELLLRKSLGERAKELEEEIKKWCLERASRICKEKGFESPECRLAVRKCELVSVSAEPPKPGTQYAMAIDLSRCIGCRRCVYACMLENNVSRNLDEGWIVVEELDLSEVIGAPLKGEKTPVPISCMHCENPPCVLVCPVAATWVEPDGIVVIDYARCIGCRYCMAACPYNARRFNWAKPVIPVWQLNPHMHVYGNVPREAHVVEKCTFCIHRVRRGLPPACVEACPTGARIFGNLEDPNSPVRRVIDEYPCFTLLPEAGTKPKVFYFFSGGVKR